MSVKAIVPQGPSGGCCVADRSSDGRMTPIVPLTRHDTTTPTNFKVQGGAMDQLWFGSSKTTSKLARVLYYQTADASTHYGVDTCQALPPNRLAPEGTYLPGPNL